MREERGASQILFGYLPGQTVDLRGKVWKVSRWNEPTEQQFDQAGLRRALLDAAGPWCPNPDLNDGICTELQRAAPVEVMRLNRRLGVEVESFPHIWRCRRCGRLSNRSSGACACGSDSRAQLHYVQFHSCGLLQEPTLDRCPAHAEVAMSLPGSAQIRDLRFYCPVCQRQLGRGGFPFRRCTACTLMPNHLERNVHRAASVFTPRFAVLINPADPAKARRLREGGGGARALQWVLDGMEGQDPMHGPPTVASLMDTLMQQGLPEDVAKELAEDALRKGKIKPSAGTLPTMPAETAEPARDGAIDLASAVMEGRTTVQDMITRSVPPLQTLYRGRYAPALELTHLKSVEFLPKFPVATLAFGYTRGDSRPGASRLVAFRERGKLRAYGEVHPTEALLFRLDPVAVHAWLVARGVLAGIARSESDARSAILSSIVIPRPVEENAQPLGGTVVELVHSYAHRSIRRLASFAGTERDSLGEYLIPHHLAFVVYAAVRGDFVLGGLQAVFETSLHEFLEDVMHGEHRCPLDPGCTAGGGACMACLHLGESSCRWFNRFLRRERLFGPGGFLR
jgi:hypothetical protein